MLRPSPVVSQYHAQIQKLKSAVSSQNAQRTAAEREAQLHSRRLLRVRSVLGAFLKEQAGSKSADPSSDLAAPLADHVLKVRQHAAELQRALDARVAAMTELEERAAARSSQLQHAVAARSKANRGRYGEFSLGKNPAKKPLQRKEGGGDEATPSHVSARQEKKDALTPEDERKEKLAAERVARQQAVREEARAMREKLARQKTKLASEATSAEEGSVGGGVAAARAKAAALAAAQKVRAQAKAAREALANEKAAREAAARERAMREKKEKAVLEEKAAAKAAARAAAAERARGERAAEKASVAAERAAERERAGAHKAATREKAAAAQLAADKVKAAADHSKDRLGKEKAGAKPLAAAKRGAASPEQSRGNAKAQPKPPKDGRSAIGASLQDPEVPKVGVVDTAAAREPEIERQLHPEATGLAGEAAAAMAGTGRRSHPPEGMAATATPDRGVAEAAARAPTEAAAGRGARAWPWPCRRRLRRPAVPLWGRAPALGARDAGCRHGSRA